MSSKNSADAILDEILQNLGVDKKKPGKGKSNSKASASSMGRRTTPMPACEPSTSFASSGSSTQSSDPAATESETEMSKLQSTVKGLADQMAWFMQKLAEDEAEPETAAELDVVDATDIPQAPNAQTWSSDEAELETDCSEMLSELEQYYGADDVVAAEIDPQLTGIVKTERKGGETRATGQLCVFRRRGQTQKFEISFPRHRDHVMRGRSAYSSRPFRP